MEDAATAEISRSQLWQWIHNGAKLDDGRPVERGAVPDRAGRAAGAAGRRRAPAGYREAVEILDGLVAEEEFTEFLTLPAYRIWTRKGTCAPSLVGSPRLPRRSRRRPDETADRGGRRAERHPRPGRDLRTYECDGLASFRARPALVVLPGSTEEVAAVGAASRRGRRCPSSPAARGRASRAARCRFRGACRWRCSRMKRILEVDLENGWMRVEPGVINLDVTQGDRRRGLLLRARPVLAERLHDRRQRRRELGRRALPQVRLHRQPRPRRAAGARATATVVDLGGPALDAPGYDLLGRAGRQRGARWASSPRWCCGSSASPRPRGPSSPPSPRPTRRGTAVCGDHRRRASCPPPSR